MLYNNAVTSVLYMLKLWGRKEAEATGQCTGLVGRRHGFAPGHDTDLLNDSDQLCPLAAHGLHPATEKVNLWPLRLLVPAILPTCAPALDAVHLWDLSPTVRGSNR